MKKIFTLIGVSVILLVSIQSYSQIQTTMNFRGEMNSWGSTAMTFEDLGTDRWIVTILSDGNDNESLFKYDATTNWTGSNWGRGDVVNLGSRTDWYSGGADGKFNETLGKYYTFTFKDIAGGANTEGFVMETSGLPINIASVAQGGTQDGAIYYASTDAQVIAITLSSSKSAEENIYLRYSTDGFSTDDFVLATGSGTTYTATIPAQSIGTVVSYYVLSTTLTYSVSGDLDTYTDLATLNYNTNGGVNYHYTVSNLRSITTGEWHSTGTWLFGAVPTSSDDVLIVDSDVITVNSPSAIAGSLDLASGASLIVSAGNSLTVTGAFTNNAGSSGVVVKSDAGGNGSLIVSGAVAANVERYMQGYDNSSGGGWHLISSAVNNLTIFGSGFVPVSGTDDLYAYSESTNTWLNYLNSSFGSFANGVGYFIARKDDFTGTFSGTLNVADVAFSNLSLTSGQGEGWHLLGNPYASALKWNDSGNSWGLSNIAATAKVWNESAGNYSDVVANGIIPSTNGFFVQATSATNAITIKEASRTHNTTNNYKTGTANELVITVSNDVNDFYDVCIVGLRQDATFAFDPEFDSHKLYGNSAAPQLASLVDGELFSTNYLPFFNATMQIEMEFLAGVDATFEMQFDGISSFEYNLGVTLEDKQTQTFVQLSPQEVYAFTGSSTDIANRFVLHFGYFAGVEEQIENNDLDVFSYANAVNVINKTGEPGIVQFYDISGKSVYLDKLSADEQSSFYLDLSPGVYIVKLNAGSAIATESIIIR